MCISCGDRLCTLRRNYCVVPFCGITENQGAYHRMPCVQHTASGTARTCVGDRTPRSMRNTVEHTFRLLARASVQRPAVDVLGPQRVCVAAVRHSVSKGQMRGCERPVIILRVCEDEPQLQHREFPGQPPPEVALGSFEQSAAYEIYCCDDQ